MEWVYCMALVPGDGPDFYCSRSKMYVVWISHESTHNEKSLHIIGVSNVFNDAEEVWNQIESKQLWAPGQNNPSFFAVVPKKKLPSSSYN